MSFDLNMKLFLVEDGCLNPFGTGQCLSTMNSWMKSLVIIVSIPLEQGNVFRLMKFTNTEKKQVSIPLEQGNVFRHGNHVHYQKWCLSQSLWNRAMSFDKQNRRKSKRDHASQSLWNRAMSFDAVSQKPLRLCVSLNPFGTGQCLSTHNDSATHEAGHVSIPLEQGNVFRQIRWSRAMLVLSLNPFGTGQCLSTMNKH